MTLDHGQIRSGDSYAQKDRLPINGRNGRSFALVMFFITAYLISWAAWVSLFVRHLSHLRGLGFWLYLTAIVAPHASASFVTWCQGGLPTLRMFYRSVFRRVPWRWLIVAVTVPQIMYLVRDAVAICFRLPHGSIFHPPPRTLATLVLGQLAVVLGEEPGWRGFALPRLTERFGANVGSIVLGVLWGLWHLPLFVIPGTPQYGTAFLPFVLLLTAWSIIITLVVRNTSGSTVGAMLFHASANICGFTMWEPDGQFFGLTPWIVAAVIAAWFIEVWTSSDRSVRTMS